MSTGAVLFSDHLDGIGVERTEGAVDDRRLHRRWKTREAGDHSTTRGFSTHGFGRVNAYEGGRLVAPTELGGRGGVDIVLRDNQLDWGNTEQLSSVLFEPIRGFIPHWGSVDIEMDAPPLPPAPVTVKLHWAFGGTALPDLPSDFWTSFPSESADRSSWHPLDVQTITNLEYC